MDLDRGHKLQCYEELPTVQHIVLAYADRKRVEHHRRTESGWERKVLSTSESVVVLDAVEFRIDLARIYFDVLLFGMQFLALPSRPIIVSAECLSNQAPGLLLEADGGSNATPIHNPTISAKRWTTCCSLVASSTSSCWAGRKKWSTDDCRIRARLSAA
jgi:hypothetical protein